MKQTGHSEYKPLTVHDMIALRKDLDFISDAELDHTLGFEIDARRQIAISKLAQRHHGPNDIVQLLAVIETAYKGALDNFVGHGLSAREIKAIMPNLKMPDRKTFRNVYIDIRSMIQAKENDLALSKKKSTPPQTAAPHLRTSTESHSTPCKPKSHTFEPI